MMMMMMNNRIKNKHSKGKIVPLRHLSGLDTSSEKRTRKARR